MSNSTGKCKPELAVKKERYLLTYLLTYLLHGAESFLEANRFSASQEIPRIFLEPEGSLPHSQVPATCP